MEHGLILCSKSIEGLYITRAVSDFLGWAELLEDAVWVVAYSTDMKLELNVRDMEL
jgi:hypothetical protein